MKWSWRAGRVAGIAIELHATLLILVTWVLVSRWLASGSLAAVLLSSGFVVGLFGSVLLHELAHALVARRFGVGTRAITLLPIGGMADLERAPDRPGQELAIAAAGPMASALLGAAFYVVAAAGLRGPREGITGASLVVAVATTNAIIAVFNLLPAFPMDGGRILRALLAMRMPHARATRLAARIGQALAALMGVIGVFSSPMLVLVALFVWIGAAEEAAAVERRARLQSLSVAGVMVTRFAAVTPDERIEDALAIAMHGFQQDFPVLEDGRLVGVLDRNDLLRAAHRGDTRALVGSVMSRTFPVCAPDERLADVTPRFAAMRTPLIPVLRGRRVVGILTLDHVEERLALSSQHAAAPRALLARMRTRPS
jgi:Zn-dependent protease/CBS domain-containing protein